MLAFIKNLAGVKFDKISDSAVEALVRWDPKSASEAELRTMEQHLDALGREVALARQGYDREKREADAIQALSHQRMAAAEQLQRQIDGESDQARKAGLEKSLETLVSMLEQMTPEIEREKSEAADAKDYLTMLEQTYAEAGGKLGPGALPAQCGGKRITRTYGSGQASRLAPYLVIEQPEGPPETGSPACGR